MLVYADDTYPFEFHPLELAEECLNDFFGYVIEGGVDSAKVNAYEIPLMRFKRTKVWQWWKFW